MEKIKGRAVINVMSVVFEYSETSLLWTLLGRETVS